MLEQLTQQLIEALSLVLVGVIATAISLGAKAAIAWLKAKVPAENLSFLKEAAKTIVRFIEQTSVWDEAMREGARKKELALIHLADWAEEHNIPLTYELADKILEEAVNIMNAEFADISFDENGQRSEYHALA